ncbi:MAG: UDP-2,3-diacylglucosamine diphosphatase [Candidatus Marinimicrobia bacterium]|jgi:UDP-2,3-diacylglucosamine hydrolase|nr:UDP-2,3-diacylglucosamine diphosphatase [Candidatus Neomarinimicrobiota bacterium]MBT3618088.1 UDP-2,3-diacylglucosamine diphosphatase [Candidatus Neomarinimicrobiota bacterium]MBT3828455.1 UDP-2,3-diacylglucosamine diphosphatase [Candidatus Neomarinimicrobiota bacterium]MBT3998074.1 UDP-2,3-diacylglucosamine diphosphatase [Candidatus Neomarinimicrobiota bacterium]MBT4280222.1 UDP-2,3-diacylglucosamine diphosphatase [Candidatus Neomarinimicrobiota bacterium]
MDLPVYFISDIHLMLDKSEKEKIRREKLFTFLRQVRSTGGTLFIVGDIFDFYFEYRDVIPKSYFDFYHELYLVKQSGVDIHYMLGNHDFWVLDFITEEITTHTYFKDTSFNINGKTFYITHGDGHLSWDRGYRLLKSLIQSKAFIWLYRYLHPNIGYKFGKWISKKGKHYEHDDTYNRKILNDLKKFASKLTESGTDFIICGHYHQATITDIGPGKLVILGDWLSIFTYGLFDGNEFSLNTWKNDV